MSRPNTVSVDILDKEYQVACPPDEEAALTQAARYLDQHMRDIRSTGKVIGLERVAIMAALNISHELLALKTGGDPVETSEEVAMENFSEKSHHSTRCPLNFWTSPPPLEPCSSVRADWLGIN